jgi:hypothetical protein
MPFRCKICELDILPGAPMVSNERDEVAHETCFRPIANLVAHTVSKPPVPAAPEPCTPSSSASVCSECGDPCIAMCPSCRKYVCPTYGYNGKTCSPAHEGKCSGARESRSIDRKSAASTLGISGKVARAGRKLRRALKHGRNGR